MCSMHSVLEGRWLGGRHQMTCNSLLSSCLPHPACLPRVTPSAIGLPSPQLGLGDDQHLSGYEAALDPWLQQLWPALRACFPLPSGAAEPAPGDTATDLVCKYRVTWLRGKEAAAAAAAAAAEVAAAAAEGCTGAAAAHREALAAARLFDRVEAAASGLPLGAGTEQQPSSRAAGAPATTAGHAGETDSSAGGYGPGRPYWARLLGNRRITAASHFQDVRQLDIELVEDASLAFQPGDVLALVPQQPAAAVDTLLRRCGWDPQAWVRVEPAAAGTSANGGCGGPTDGDAAAEAASDVDVRAAAAQSSSNRIGTGGQAAAPSATVRLGALLAGALDINGASPRRFFFQVGPRSCKCCPAKPARGHGWAFV